MLSTVAVLLLACIGAYLGCAICLALTISGFEGHAGPGALASTAAYVLAAYAVPIGIGAHWFRTRGWSLVKVLRLAAAISLAVNVALSPIGIAVLSM